MTEWATLFTAFSLGVFGSAHCVGMCGGIMGALTLAIPRSVSGRRWQLLLSYNLGRISSYTLMGLLLGLFAGAFSSLGGALWLRVLAGALLIAMGLYLADWWRGLVYLERAGKYFWAYLQPLGKGLMPVSSAPKALMLGMLWGWLPCGLVYSALAYAMAQAQPALSAAVMLAFGLGTLPAVIATGFAAQQLTRLLQRRYVRIGFALLIIIFGIWTLIGGTHNHSAHSHHATHAPHRESQSVEPSVTPASQPDTDQPHSHH
jgi:hypothetical protein